MDERPYYREADPKLCQGDIVAHVPHVRVPVPLSVARKKTGPGGIDHWTRHEVNHQLYPDIPPHERPPGAFQFTSPKGDTSLLPIQVGFGIVLSHGCEIDKDQRNRQVALIRPLSVFQEEHRAIVRHNEDFSYFYLPAIPEKMDESYVDFRRVTCIDPGFILEQNRVASLTPYAEHALQMQFFHYLTRLIPKDVVALFGDYAE